METINGQRVVCIEDYQNTTARDLINNETFKLDIPKSNVLIYYLEDGTKICARPSGTEPKIKCYLEVVVRGEDLEIARDTADNELRSLASDAGPLLSGGN